MTAFLPPNLLALFAARDPIPYVQPVDKPGHEKKRISYGGVAQYLKEFEDPKDTPPPTRVETKDERKERKRKERAEQIAYKLEQDLALWDPHAQVTTDPYKSLFVARVNFDTSESKLRREFEVFGPVRKIKVIQDKVNGKPRGYTFIEFEHERDMHSAYKHADGKKIDGRRVLVDVERGRTVKGWRPRRLGGGLGGTRKGGPDENTRFSGRDDFSGGRNRDRDRDREDFPRGGDRGDRGDRGERPDRPDRPDRPERPERPDRGDRVEREAPPRDERRERRRSRSRDRRRRSRSRDKKREGEGEERKRTRRSRSPRDRKRSRSRDRKRRRSRSRDRKVKEEPQDAVEGQAEEGGYEGQVPTEGEGNVENGNEEGYDAEVNEEGEMPNDDGVPIEG